MIPLIDLTLDKNFIKKIEHEVSSVINSNHYILGNRLKRLEKEFAKFIGVKEAIGVANGTDALTLALMAFGIGKGDKVLTVSFTSPFTTLAILQSGAEPVYVDIDDKTLTINLTEAEKKISKRVKAIIPVHIYGNPCCMDKIVNLAKKYDLKIIEDAAQAHGAVYKNKKVGSWGDAGTFSFYPTKNLGAMGDAGIIVTNNAKLADKIRKLRHGGQTQRFWHLFRGINSRLDEIQAAILELKLKKLTKNNLERKRLAKNYFKNLAGLPLKFQETFDEGQSAFHLFVIRTQERNKLMNYLIKNGIGCDIYYPYPVHKQPAFREFEEGILEVTERVCREILALPLFPGLKSFQQDYIVKNISNFFDKR